MFVDECQTFCRINSIFGWLDAYANGRETDPLRYAFGFLSVRCIDCKENAVLSFRVMVVGYRINLYVSHNLHSFDLCCMFIQSYRDQNENSEFVEKMKNAFTKCTHTHSEHSSFALAYA